MKSIIRDAIKSFTILLILCSFSCGGSERTRDELSAFKKAELEWREECDQGMKKPTSWLTIAGLFWLDEGENTFGTGSENDIRLPEGSAPSYAGIFTLQKEGIKVVAAEGAGITYNDSIIEAMMLQSDAEGKPDVIQLNDLKMWVIKRGDRYAIRLRDLNAPRYRNYHGLKFFPPREEYRVRAAFVPFPEPKTVKLATVVGTETEMPSPGYLEFRIGKKELRLDVFGEDPESKNLFIIFKDRTSGRETHGACRFLASRVLDDGSVDLNFNRAYNPPCAYTPYATCPLPPQQNELSVPIKAGEKQYEKGH